MGPKQKCWHMTPSLWWVDYARRPERVQGWEAVMGRGRAGCPQTRREQRGLGKKVATPLSQHQTSVPHFMWDLVKPGEFQRAKAMQCVGRSRPSLAGDLETFSAPKHLSHSSQVTSEARKTRIMKAMGGPHPSFLGPQILF